MIDPLTGKKVYVRKSKNNLDLDAVNPIAIEEEIPE